MDEHRMNAPADSTLLICASPRARGTSMMLLQRVQAATGGQIVSLYREKDTKAPLERMARADAIVISGPCYINTYPAPVLALLEAAALQAPWAGQRLYGIINGGMPYLHTHRQGLESLQLFARACGLRWMGGFVLGGGAMLDGQPLEKHLSARRVVPAFAAFAGYIAAGSPAPDSLYEQAQRPPGGVMARVFSAFLNRMVDKGLRRHGHDPYGPLPYGPLPYGHQ